MLASTAVKIVARRPQQQHNARALVGAVEVVETVENSRVAPEVPSWWHAHDARAAPISAHVVPLLGRSAPLPLTSSSRLLVLSHSLSHQQ